MRHLVVGLLAVLFVSSCQEEILPPNPPEKGVVGVWQWSGKASIPAFSPDSILVRRVLTLRGDSTSTYVQYFGDKYDRGCAGPWMWLARDTVGTHVVDCFKGDANGVAKPNTCAEDFADPVLRFPWSVSNISISSPTQTEVFQRIE